MKLLLVSDEAPDRSATGNGSTMISANVIPRLPPEISVHLAYGDDGRRELDPAVRDRCSSLLPLALPSRRRSLLAAPFSRLPRASWRLAVSRDYSRLRAEAPECDVLLVHGLHAFGLALRLVDDMPLPLVAQEIDDWSTHWRQQASLVSGPRARYLSGQAQRAEEVEQQMAARADRYLVVAPDEAQRLADRLRRPVIAIPNGVSTSEPERDSSEVHTPAHARAPVIGFLGTLDYAPNVEAVGHLCGSVLPLVQREVPTATVRIAGRRLTPDVARLAGAGVTIVGEVDDPGAFYRSVAVMAYPGATGTGTKNTVLEALAAGAAVVASAASARSVPDEGQLVIADSAEQVAEALVELLVDPDRRRALGGAAARWAALLPDWEATAQRYAGVLRSVIPANAEGRDAASS